MLEVCQPSSTKAETFLTSINGALEWVRIQPALMGPGLWVLWRRMLVRSVPCLWGPAWCVAFLCIQHPLKDSVPGLCRNIRLPFSHYDCSFNVKVILEGANMTITANTLNIRTGQYEAHSTVNMGMMDEWPPSPALGILRDGWPPALAPCLWARPWVPDTPLTTAGPSPGPKWPSRALPGHPARPHTPHRCPTILWPARRPRQIEGRSQHRALKSWLVSALPRLPSKHLFVLNTAFFSLGCHRFSTSVANQRPTRDVR